MTLSAWRPLKDAPVEGTILARLTSGELARATAAVVHVGRDYDGSGGWPEAAWVNEDTGQVIRDDDLVGWLPIADTLELDRAVQGEIARAFGELLGGLKVASQQARSWSRFAREQVATDHRRNAVSNFRRILHTSMGGRIPDEVP